MQTIRLLERTGKDGKLSFSILAGKPEVEYEIVLILQPRNETSTEERGWPPGYFDLAGSIHDETFVRPEQGELPLAAEFE
jgi:hypothetical protein